MKAILIDDEELALKYLEYQLHMIDGVEVVGAYTDPLEGKRAAEQTGADVVFLDIHIPELDGLQLAEKLLESNPELHVVFITTFGEYAIKAFELNALDYLLKPVQLDRLRQTVQRLQERSPKSGGAAANPDQWEIRMFGKFRITVDHQESRTLHFRTSKAQELFFYLLHHREKFIHKSSLMDMLWPELELSKAAPLLYTAVYHIRKTLGPIGDRIILDSASEGYTLRLKNVELDAALVDQFLHSVPALSQNTAGQYERITILMQGEYLEEYGYDWAEYERHRYHFHWIRLSLLLANWYYEHQQYEKAFHICDRI